MRKNSKIHTMTNENNKSQNVRVHHLVITCVVFIWFLSPIVIRDFYPNTQAAILMRSTHGYGQVIYYLVTFPILYLMEKNILKNEWYRNSFFMKEVGNSNTNKKL